jgi:predicted aspartyl protease
VHGAAGRSLVIETLLDTGNSDALTLRPGDIQLLGLTYQGMEQFVLADGASVMLAVYLGEVLWNGTLKRTIVLASDGGSMLGMLLLKGHRLIADVCLNGDVTIEPLATTPLPHA